MGAITVITSGKGGVGKSTVTVGLGTSLARRGRRVLLIDMEAGLRGLEKILGVEELLLFDVSDIVNGNCEPMEAIYSCEPIHNLFLLPAPSKTEESLREDQMKRLCKELSPYFDHILIDCPAGIGREFRVSVCAAQRALVVVNPDPVGLRCGGPVNKLLEEAGITDNRLVINRFDPDSFSGLHFYEDLDAVIDAVGIRLIAVIPEDIHLTKAAATGKPCLPGLPGTMAFDRMAARFEGEMIPVML